MNHFNILCVILMVVKLAFNEEFSCLILCSFSSCSVTDPHAVVSVYIINKT